MAIVSVPALRGAMAGPGPRVRLSRLPWRLVPAAALGAPLPPSGLEVERRTSYTPGMKTAVSVPDDLFARVDRLARRSRRSRSEVYSAALREYLARHAPDEVTAALDATLALIGQPDTEAFSARAARRTLESSEW